LLVRQWSREDPHHPRRVAARAPGGRRDLRALLAQPVVRLGDVSHLCEIPDRGHDRRRAADTGADHAPLPHSRRVPRGTVDRAYDRHHPPRGDDTWFRGRRAHQPPLPDRARPRAGMAMARAVSIARSLVAHLAGEGADLPPAVVLIAKL